MTGTPVPNALVEGDRSARRIAPAANEFSCFNCRRRKTKCDKNQPCRSCVKTRLSCIFPPLRRLSKHHKEPELIAKMQRLEQMINTMTSGRNASPPRNQLLTEGDQFVLSRPPLASLDNPSPRNAANRQAGKLMKDGSKSVYINGSYWALLTSEFDHGQTDNDQEPEYDQEQQQRSNMKPLNFTFPFSQSPQAFVPMHPSVENRQRLWSVYKENVEPLIMVLHVPSTEARVQEWLSREDVDHIPRDLDALLGAIYLAAVSSLEDDICLEIFGRSSEELAASFRTAVEQALARAHFLNTDSLTVIQALVIYVVVVRCFDPKLSWTLSGLAFRLVQSLGAHRDGASLGLSPFQSEMHKRLSWILCIFECPAADDNACDTTIMENSSFDAPLPKNLDSVDLSLDMREYPREHDRWTDSMLLVIYAEVASLRRSIYDSRRIAKGTEKSFHSMSLSEQSNWVNSCVDDFVRQYVQPCSAVVPLQWTTATVARVLILEFKMVACKALERHSELDQAELDEYFTDSLECVEYNNKLQTDSRSRKWVWFFKSLTQWRPLAFLLTEMGVRPIRKDALRAWRVAEQAVVSRWTSPQYTGGFQWRAMMRLMNNARAARAHCIKERNNVPRNGTNRVHGGGQIPSQLNALRPQDSNIVAPISIPPPPNGPEWTSPIFQPTPQNQNSEQTQLETVPRLRSIGSGLGDLQDISDWESFMDIETYMDTGALDEAFSYDNFLAKDVTAQQAIATNRI